MYRWISLNIQEKTVFLGSDWLIHLQVTVQQYNVKASNYVLMYKSQIQWVDRQ